MAFWKVIACDNTTDPQYQIYLTMKISQLHNCISADSQARIDPLSIPLIKM